MQILIESNNQTMIATTSRCRTCTLHCQISARE